MDSRLLPRGAYRRPIICAQNQYNLAQRADDALIAGYARDGIAYVLFSHWAVSRHCRN